MITNTGPWGTGSFTSAKAIAEEFIELGHQVKIFFPDSGIATEESDFHYTRDPVYHIWKFPLKNEEINIDFFPLMIPDPHPRNPFRNTFSDLSDTELCYYFSEFEKEIIKVIRDFKPDIIECQHIWAMDYVIQKLQIPYICTAHHSDQLGFLFDSRMNSYAIKSAQDAQYIFSISNYVKKEVVDLYDVLDEKVIVLNNGYDKKVFQNQYLDRRKTLNELKLDIPEEAFIVSFAGKVSRTKGVDIILEANKMLPDDANIHFVICGAGEVSELLEAEQRERVSLTNVHFIGHREPNELAKIHNISNISAMPSRSEGFGIASLEAMACGLPIIFTRSGGLEEFAIGKVIDKENPEMFKKALLELVHMDKEQFYKLSQKAIEVAHQFSWARISKKRLEYYDRVLEDNPKF